MKRTIQSLILFFFLPFSGQFLLAQKTSIYREPEATYRSGVDLFEKEKYGAAQKEFEWVIEAVENPLSELRVNAEYYDALCSLELFNRDAEYKFTEFMKNHPTTSRANLINFQLGRLAYNNKKFNSARDYFASVDVTELGSEEESEYFFKNGYCFFKTDDFDKAKQDFEMIRNPDSKYASPAAYFLAHIAYLEKDYDKALTDFNKLLDDPNFSAIAPYYIVQILYAQGKYEDVLQQAPPLLKQSTEKRAPEIAHIIGESYYRTDRFKEALPYLQQYYTTTRSSVSREDQYTIGYACYKTKDYDEALKYFQNVTGPQDSLSQYAYYYLADCYLKTDQKKFAANAFNAAFKLPFDKEISEDALFNQAQLAFELSYDPYSEAIKALREYLKSYPNSSRNDEAYHFLFKIAMATRNFEDAQEAIENIKRKGKDYDRDLQKISYYRGIELYNKLEYAEALLMFKKAIATAADKTIAAEATFWAGEACYQQGDYAGAKKLFMDFLSASGAKALPVFTIAYYDLGYVNFKRQDYNGTIYYLNEFISKGSKEDPKMIADAYLRIGDSWFISKGYDNALDFYNKAIKMDVIDVDYALFQKAITLGVLQRYAEKIQTLKTLANRYPNATNIAEVYFELGNTYLVNKDNENALINFKKIISDYPSSSYAVRAMLKAGLIYYNSGLNDLALNTFKKVVSEYPDSPESKEALGSIKNIYIDINQVDEYIAYASELPSTEVSPTEQDSLTYIAAQNLYMEGNCNSAMPSMEAYLEKFPVGAFRTNASFYLAECESASNDLQKALENYDYVISSHNHEFLESSLVKAAQISYSLEDYTKSLEYYTYLEQIAEQKQNRTEAIYGQMKCNNKLGHYADALDASEKLLQTEKLSDNRREEALMIRANALYSMENYLEAEKAYKEVVAVSQGVTGAESKYKIAQIEFLQKNYDLAEKEIFDLIKKYAAYDYWVASGFILLSDVYMKKGNTFQAKQTLQSILDNYKGEDLKRIASGKLDEILSGENAAKKSEIRADSLENVQDTLKINGDNLK